jgi:hypothetical protein
MFLLDLKQQWVRVFCSSSRRSSSTGARLVKNSGIKRISMKKPVQKFLFSLVWCWFACCAHARLGDGPLVDELLRESGAVYAGHFTGYDFATVGQTSVWLVAEFTVDHAIKGNIATNKIDIVGYRLEKAGITNEIRRLLSPIKKFPRCLVFVRKINEKTLQYKMTDEINGLLPAYESKPFVQVSAGTEERLSVELSRAQDELDARQREHFDSVVGDWLKTRKESKPKLKDIRSKP